MSIISDLISGGLSGILQPIASMFTKKEDVKLEMFKVDGKVDLGLLNAYKEQLQVRRDILAEQMKHTAGRAMQYGFVYPLIVWWIAVIVYCILHPYFPSIKTVLALPKPLDDWAGVMIGFVFLASKIDEWKRKT